MSLQRPFRFTRSWGVAAVAAGALVGSLMAVPATATAATVPGAPAVVTNPAQYVNTLAGTGDGGGTVGSINNFPGPAMPFGMTQFSPDTNSGTTPYGSYSSGLRGQGYYYPDVATRGFSVAHASQGCGALGDFPILPSTYDNLTGTGNTNGPWSRRNIIDHSTEVGQVGYYKVTANDGSVNITSELSATTRGGVAAFTFPAGVTRPKVFVKANQAAANGRYNSEVSIDTATGILTGRAQNGNFCAKSNRYDVYYALAFEQSYTEFGTWTGGTAAVANRTSASSATSTENGAYFVFPNGTQVVRARMAISYVSAANALLNLTTEIPTLNSTTLDSVRAANVAAWNEYLGKVQVSGPVSGQSDRDLRTFYTAMYHSITHPSTFSDVNGQYIGFETTPIVHNVTEKPGANGRQRVQYSMFSDWDTYRSQASEVAMFWPQIASDQAQSLTNAAEQMGSFPKWMFMNATTNQMTGDSPTALLAFVYAFGARDWDTGTALHYMVEGAVGDSAGKWTGGTNNGLGNTLPMIERPGAWIYNEKHYAPQVRYYQADHAITGASITQEWSIDDFAISQFAKALGNTAVEEQFFERSHYWQNLFNATTGFVQPRDINGKFQEGNPLQQPSTDFGWVTPNKNPDNFGQIGFDEGNAEQYVWLEPQNFAGLIDALGGKAATAQRLDVFMTRGLNVGDKLPYMWAGNEPDFGVPWIYNYLGQPWRTADVVDQMTQTLFGDTPAGAEPGNDDLGAQASWLVWAGIGMYPATPGTDVLTVNTPMFDKTVVKLGNGKTLTINADGAQTGRNYQTGKKYINGMKINDTSTTKTWFDYSILNNDTVIDYDIGTGVHNDWGTGDDDAPPSWREGGHAVVANVNPVNNAQFGVVGLTPGGSGGAQLDVQRIESKAETFTVSLTASEPGIALSAVGTRTFNSKGHGTVGLTFTADSFVPSDTYKAQVVITAGDDTAVADVTLRVTKPGSFDAARTVVGTSFYDAVKGRFDTGTSGTNTYSRDSLISVGLAPGAVRDVTDSDGVTTTFTWPGALHSYPEVMVPTGQTVQLDRPASRISFVGASGGGSAQDTVDLRLSMSDGSTYTTASADLSFGDWVLPSAVGDKTNGTLTPMYGNTVVAWTPQRNASTGAGDPGAYVFATKTYVAPAGKKVVAVRFGGSFQANSALRVFAIAQDAPEITVAPVSAVAGDSLSVTGSGFAAGEPVTVTLNTAPKGEVVTTADALGIISTVVPVPRSVTASGTYAVSAASNSIPRSPSAQVQITTTTTPPPATTTTTPPPATTTTTVPPTVVPTVVPTTIPPVVAPVVVPVGAPATGAGGAAQSNGSPLMGFGGLALLLSGAAMVTAIRCGHGYGHPSPPSGLTDQHALTCNASGEDE